MSFILDALRKSESERQRNQRPGMANMQVPKPRRGSGIWLPLVALLVGINLSLLLVMWIMGDSDELATSSTVARSPGAVSEAIQPDAVPPQSERRLSEEITALQDTAAPDARVPEEPAANVYAANANDEYDSLPTLDELVWQNAITIPPMRLDIHVYSDDPSERFVFINMSRYNEGSTLSEGPKLMAITQTGIVLRFQGQEFLVTRE
jgi:general secretion pathway protein B